MGHQLARSIDYSKVPLGWTRKLTLKLWHRGRKRGMQMQREMRPRIRGRFTRRLSHSGNFT